MTAHEDTITISAQRRVPAGEAEAFAFLMTPATHRRLQGPGLTLLSLDATDAEEIFNGGAVLLRGPLGLQRAVRTRVALRQPPTRLAGSALADSGTAAHISWTLRGQSDGTTLVELTAVLGPVGYRDRLLLAIGGRQWMRRLFTATLRKLAAELKGAPDGRPPTPNRTPRGTGNGADLPAAARHRFRLAPEPASFDRA